MYCSNCGNEVMEQAPYCSACGAKVGESPLGNLGAAAGAAISGIKETIASQASQRQAVVVAGNLDPRATMADRTDGAQGYSSYEYARTTVKTDLGQVTLDCYESLGYELTGQRSAGASGQVTLSFRRSRKIKGKAQLSKIQREMDDMIAHIAKLEAAKTSKAVSQSIGLGIVSALVLGLGMCCTMVWTHLMVLGIIVGVVGIIGCIFTFLKYRNTVAKESARVEPQIEQTYDRLATKCEEAQALLAL